MELKLERQMDGEDLDIPNIITLDMRLIVEKHQRDQAVITPVQQPRRSCNKHAKRINLGSIAAIAGVAPEPARKRSRKAEVDMEMATLETEIAEISKLLQTKRARLELLQSQVVKKKKSDAEQ